MNLIDWIQVKKDLKNLINWYRNGALLSERFYLIFIIFMAFFVIFSNMNKGEIYKILYILFLTQFSLITLPIIWIVDKDSLLSYKELSNRSINIFLRSRLFILFLILSISQFLVITIISFLNFIIIGNSMLLTFSGYFLLLISINIYNLFVINLINWLGIKYGNFIRIDIQNIKNNNNLDRLMNNSFKNLVKDHFLNNLNSKGNYIAIFTFSASFLLYGMQICAYIYVYFNSQSIYPLTMSKSLLATYTSIMIDWFILICILYIILSWVLWIKTKAELITFNEERLKIPISLLPKEIG